MPPLLQRLPKRRGRPPKREKEKGHPAPQEQDSSSFEDPTPRLRQGVAKDRVLSVVDPQMRVGHKSKRQSWAGYKVHIAEEPQSELITSVEVRPANEYDAALSVVEQQKESVGLLPKELLCDGAYGSVGSVNVTVREEPDDLVRLARAVFGRIRCGFRL